jgi:hypothetical protein
MKPSALSSAKFEIKDKPQVCRRREAAWFALLVALVFEIIRLIKLVPGGKDCVFPSLNSFFSRSEPYSQGCAVCRAPRSGLALTVWDRIGYSGPAVNIVATGLSPATDPGAINHLFENLSRQD